MPDVHALFIRDLYKFFGELRDEGNNVVLGMDANDDVWDGEVTKAFMEIDIFKAVVSNHGGESVPATCATNKQRKPIDSIWTSPVLTVLRCGFLPFVETYGFKSDHRLIWVDMCNKDLLEHRPQYIHHAPVSNVKPNTPDIREMYIQRCLENYEREGAINDFQTLASFCQKTLEGTNMRDKIIHLHASLAIKIEKIQMEVDNFLGQFFNSSVPWSQTIQVHRDCIDYWHHLLRIKMGVLTSKNAIKRMSIKLGEYSG